jgi:hypothetical protein
MKTRIIPEDPSRQAWAALRSADIARRLDEHQRFQRRMFVVRLLLAGVLVVVLGLAAAVGIRV